jgi:hypothetical protein
MLNFGFPRAPDSIDPGTLHKSKSTYNNHAAQQIL